MNSEYPILAIRGISDVVGFKRDAAWTEYACNTAAAIFFAFLRVLPRNNAQHTAAPSRAPGRPGIGPQLLIRYEPEDPIESLIFINDGPGAVTNVDLGDLTWGSEQRKIGLISKVGTVESGHKMKRRVWLEDGDNTTTNLFDFMRTHTPHDAEMRVDVRYADSQGNEYHRVFSLTTQIDGNIEWSPGPTLPAERPLGKAARLVNHPEQSPESPRRKARYEKIPATEPVLRPVGLGSLALAKESRAQTVAVDNIQIAAENTAKNCALTLYYQHASGAIQTMPGVWLPRDGFEPLPSVVVNFEYEARWNATYLFQDGSRKYFIPTFADGTLRAAEPASIGTWRVVLEVDSTNARLLRFGVRFRINSDSLLADQFLVPSGRKFASWLKGADDEAAEEEEFRVSLPAEWLIRDLADQCTVHYNRSAPAIVMPRPGGGIPRNKGQIDGAIIDELRERGLASIIREHCVLTAKGQIYVDEFFRPLS